MDLPPGVTTGIAALKACGMQHEFAAHLTLLTAYTQSFIVIRACHSPNFDRRHIAAKPSYIRTKTSQNQGFFNSYIAVNPLFQRIIKNHDGINHSHVLPDLTKAITDPDYIHQTQLTVTTHDLIKQLNTDGDLLFDSYDPLTRQLILKFKADKGLDDFRANGRFVIKLDEACDWTPSYTRPWNKPTDAHVDELLENLKSIPENLILNKEFKLYFKQQPDAELQSALVLAEIPRTIEHLRAVIKELEGILPENFPVIPNNLTQEQALKLLGPANLATLYSHPEAARVITGDWDGLLLGVNDKTNNIFLTSYNTFNGQQEINKLLEQSQKYFEYLKRFCIFNYSKNKNNNFYPFIANLKFEQLISGTPFKQLGIISPAEFVFQQLINYTYRLPDNSALGEVCKNRCIDQDSDSFCPNKAHLDSDQNIQNLFQHGFDMHNPHGPENDGGWIMMVDGMQFHGTHYAQLSQLLLMNNAALLKNKYFDVSCKMDMRPVLLANGTDIGWGAVVKKQLELKQPVSKLTRQAYLCAHSTNPNGSQFNNMLLRLFNPIGVVKNQIEKLLPHVKMGVFKLG